MAVTPNGAQVVSGSKDMTVKVWDLASGLLLRSLEGHTNSVSTVAITPDGSQVEPGPFRSIPIERDDIPVRIEQERGIARVVPNG